MIDGTWQEALDAELNGEMAVLIRTRRVGDVAACTRSLDRQNSESRRLGGERSPPAALAPAAARGPTCGPPLGRGLACGSCGSTAHAAVAVRGGASVDACDAKLPMAARVPPGLGADVDGGGRGASAAHPAAAVEAQLAIQVQILSELREQRREICEIREHLGLRGPGSAGSASSVDKAPGSSLSWLPHIPASSDAWSLGTARGAEDGETLRTSNVAKEHLFTA